VPKNYLALDEAQLMIAQDAGFGSWDALLQSQSTGAAPIPPYEVDAKDNRIAPRRTLIADEWDRFIDAIREQRVTAVDAQGLMTDELLGTALPVLASEFGLSFFPFLVLRSSFLVL
jgi:hypothetical protein